MMVAITIAVLVYGMIGFLAALAHYGVFGKWPDTKQLFMYWRDPQ